MTKPFVIMKKLSLLMLLMSAIMLCQAKFRVTITPKVLLKGTDTLEFLQKSFELKEEGTTEIFNLAKAGEKYIGIQFTANEVVENGNKSVKIRAVLFNQPKKKFAPMNIEFTQRVSRMGQKLGGDIRLGKTFFQYALSVDDYDTYVDRYFKKKDYVQSFDFDIMFRYLRVNNAILKSNKKVKFTNLKEGESSDTIPFKPYNGEFFAAYVTIERNEDFEDHKFNMVIHFIVKRKGEWVEILKESAIALQGKKLDAKKKDTSEDQYKLSYGMIYNVMAAKYK